MADFVFEDPFNDSIDDIRNSLFEQVNTLWPDPNNRPDTREGSLMWTLLSPIAFEIQRFQSDLNLALELGFLQFTFGEFLDLKGIEFGLPRKQGSDATGILRFLGNIGVTVPVGTTASNEIVLDGDEQYLFDTTEVGITEGVANPASLNEQQKIDIIGTGRFTLTMYDKTTTPLNANDTGATIEAALEALSPVTDTSTSPATVFTNVQVTGDSGIANAGGATITFDGGDVVATDIADLIISPYWVNEEQLVTVTSIGNMTLEFDGETTTTLDENSDAATVEAALEALSSANYPTIEVSVTGTDLASGLTVVFDGGSVEHKDVPSILITGGGTGTVVTTVAGEDSDIVGVLTEVVKGRSVMDIPSTANQDEIQRISYTPASFTVNTIVEGQPGPRNEVQTITSPVAPTVGSTFTITFDANDGMGPQVSGPIGYDYGANQIETVLVSMPNIEPGDVSVTLASGGPTFDAAAGTSFDIELLGNLRYETYGIMTISNLAGDWVGNAPIVTRKQTGAQGNNEQQGISYTGGVAPSGGQFFMTLKRLDTSQSEILPDIPYDVTAGQLQSMLEDLTVFADSGLSPSGTNFSVTGGPLNTSPIYITFKGKNRYLDFAPVVLTRQFTGTPTSGVFQLRFNDGISTQSTGNIPYNATTQQFTTALETASNIGAGDVLVTLAGNIQTIDFSTTGQVSGNFQLTVDDGAGPLTTGNIAYNATAADVENELTLLGVDAVVEDSGATLDNGGTYTVYFTDPTVTYKHMTTTQPVPLSPATTINIGPTLDVDGVGYLVEFQNSLASANYAQMTYDTGTNTLSPLPNNPTIFTVTDGGFATNEVQLVTITHPATFYKLGFGGVAPLTTSFITVYDTATSIKHKLEALGAVGLGDITVSGTPLTTSPALVTFGGTLAGADQPLMTVPQSLIVGGTLTAPVELQPGFGGTGDVTGTVRYAYTYVTNLGIQDGADDLDYEEGYGETAGSIPTAPVVVANNSVLLSIDPVVRGSGLQTIREIKIHRSLNNGPYKYIGSIPESNISFTFLGDNAPPPPMYFVDNLSAANFAAITTTMVSSNTTGVVDVAAQAQEVLDVDGNKIGSAQNLAARTIEVLEDIVAGISKVTNPEPFGGGSDKESDDDYRARLIEEAQKDPGAGNIDDYISWAKEIDGIESVTVIPEWQEIYGPLEGPGTVKVIVAGENSTTLPDSKIEEVRQYIAGTIAIPPPDQLAGPAVEAVAGGSIEDGIYEYVYTFINVGKGETEPTPAGRVTIASPDNSAKIYMEKGQGGIGVQNTIGRRVYRRKVDGALSGEPDSDRFVLVAEILNNVDTEYTDTAAYLSLPTWTGYPDGPYQRRKAPSTNSTSLYDGEAPIGAHVTVESITDETIWVSATIYPALGYSIDGTGGSINLTTELDTLLQEYFASLPAGQDIVIKHIENVLHDYAGVHDFKDTTLYSPAFPSGTTSNIPIGDGVSAQYSSAGTFTLWASYEFDK